MENPKKTMPADTSVYSAEQIKQLFLQKPQVVLYGYTKKEMDTVIAYRRRVNMLREAACYSPIEDTLVEVIPVATADTSLISVDVSKPTGASYASDDNERCTRNTIDSDDGFVDSSRAILCADVSRPKSTSAGYVGEGPEEFSRKRKTIDSDEGFVDSSGVVRCVTSTFLELQSPMSVIDTDDSDDVINGSAVSCAKRARIENCDNEPQTLSPEYFKENVSNNVDGSMSIANGKLNTKVDERNTKNNVVFKESDFVERKNLNRSCPVNRRVISPLMIDLTDDVEKSSSREPTVNFNPTTIDLSEDNHEARRNKSQSRDEAADLKSKERTAGPRSVSTGRTVSPLTCILTRTMPEFVPFSNAKVPIRQVNVSSEENSCSWEDNGIYVEKDSMNVCGTKELSSFVSPEFVDCGKRDTSRVFLLDVDEEETTGETILPDVELPSKVDFANRNSNEKQDVNPPNKMKRKVPETENCAEGNKTPKETRKKKRKKKSISTRPESHRNNDQPDLVPDTSEKRDNLVSRPAMQGGEKPQVVQKGPNLPETSQPDTQINVIMPLTNVSTDTALQINDVPSPLSTGHEGNNVQTVPLNCSVPRVSASSHRTETGACLPSVGGQSLNCDPISSANVGCDDSATSESVSTLDGVQSQSNMGSPSYSTSNDNHALIENTNSMIVELANIIGFIVKQFKTFFVECTKFIRLVDNSTALFEVSKNMNAYIKVVKPRVFTIHKSLQVVFGSDFLIRVLYAITKSVTAEYGVTYTPGLCQGILYNLLEADRMPVETEIAGEKVAGAPVSQLPNFVRMLELLKEITLVENSNVNSIQPESVHPSRATTTSDQLQPPQMITSSSNATAAPHTRQVRENNNGSWQFHNLSGNLPQKETQFCNTCTIPFPVSNIDINKLPPNHATNPSTSFPYRNPLPNNQSTYETSGVIKNPVHGVDNVTSAIHSNDLSSQPSQRRGNVPQPTTSMESQNLPQNHGTSSACTNSATRLDIEQLPQKRVIFTNTSDRLRAMVNAKMSKNIDSSLKQIAHEAQQQRVSQIDLNLTNGKYLGLPVKQATLQSTIKPYRNPHQEVPQNVSHHLERQDHHTRITTQAPIFQERSPQHTNDIVRNPQFINPAPQQVPVHPSKVSYSGNTNIAGQQNFGDISGYNLDKHINPSNFQSQPSTKTTFNRPIQSQVLPQSVAPQPCSPASRCLTSTNTSANETWYPTNNQQLRLPHNNIVSLNNQWNCNVPETISSNPYNNYPQTNKSTNVTWHPPNNQDLRLPHNNSVSLNTQRNCNVPEPILANTYNNYPKTTTSANGAWYPPNNQDVRLPYCNTVPLNNQRNCNVPEPISANTYNNLPMRPTPVQPAQSNSMVSPQQVSQYNQTLSKEVPNTVAYAVRESHQPRSTQPSMVTANMMNPAIRRTTESSMPPISNHCGVIDARAGINHTPALTNLLTTDMAGNSKTMQQSGSQPRRQITVRDFAKTTAPNQSSLPRQQDTRGNHIPPSHVAATRCTDSSIAESHLNRMQSAYADKNHHAAPLPTYSYIRSSNSNVQSTSTVAKNVSRHENPGETVTRRTLNPNFAYGTSTGDKAYCGNAMDQATIGNRRMCNAANVQRVSADPVEVNGSVHQSLRGHADNHNMPATGNFQPLSRQLDTTGSCSQKNKSTSAYQQPPKRAVQPPTISDQGSWNANTQGNTGAYRVAADEVEVTSTLTRKSLHSSHHSLDSGVGLMSPTTSEACSESPGLAPLAANETLSAVAPVAKTRRRRKKTTEPSHRQEGGYDDDVLRCVCCKKEADVMCSGCKSRFYCTYECQKIDWVTIHSFVCGM